MCCRAAAVHVAMKSICCNCLARLTVTYLGHVKRWIPEI